jgi:hypothetical protein
MTHPRTRRLSRREQVAAVAESPASTQSFPFISPSTGPPPDLSGDLLFGAAAIAEFLFGTEGERRKVYSLIDSGSIPVFRWGTTICARKSTILQSIAAREAAAVTEPAE